MLKNVRHNGLVSFTDPVSKRKKEQVKYKQRTNERNWMLLEQIFDGEQVRVEGTIFVPQNGCSGVPELDIVDDGINYDSELEEGEDCQQIIQPVLNLIVVEVVPIRQVVVLKKLVWLN